jgi:hypothetical protein
MLTLLLNQLRITSQHNDLVTSQHNDLVTLSRSNDELQMCSIYGIFTVQDVC